MTDSSENARSWGATRTWFAVAILLCMAAWCHTSRAQGVVVWHSPEFATPKSEYTAAYPVDQLGWLAIGASEQAAPKPALWYHSLPPVPADGLGRAEVAYAAATFLEETNSPLCVEYYYLTCWNAWPHVPPDPRKAAKASKRAWNLYHSATAKLLTQAVKHQRWDPLNGVTLRTPLGEVVLQPRYQGFSWRPSDFDRFVLVGEYAAPPLQVRYATPGIGVPVVVEHDPPQGERFLAPRIPFPATVLLRPHTEPRVAASGWEPVTVAKPGAAAAPRRLATMEFSDPRRVSDVRIPFGTVPLARDISSALAWMLKSRPSRHAKHGRRDEDGASEGPGGLGSATRGRLLLTEPHSKGKIPVVFVHGLFSNTLAWANVVNELQVVPEIEKSYEFWVFEYDTAQDFLTSASALRSQLYEVTSQLDPQGYDLGLGRIVLVGHSMGGLISKLQATSSGDRLWRVTAKVPIQALQADEITRQRLEEAFFFEPVPFVRRVIYVGTPHRGSPCAGKIPSVWVATTNHHDPEIEAYRELIRANRDAFYRPFRHRPPNSIDLLSPQHPLLKAIEILPVNPHTTFHSIIGTAHDIPGHGAGDGVVPVTSARERGVASECYVNALHRELLLHAQTVREIKRILQASLRP